MKLRLPLPLAALLVGTACPVLADPLPTPVLGEITATEEQVMTELRVGTSSGNADLTIRLDDDTKVIEVSNIFHVDSAVGGTSSLDLESGTLRVTSSNQDGVWIGGSTNNGSSRSVEVNIKGGILEILNTKVSLSRWGQKATVNIDGGTANLRGLYYKGRESPADVNLLSGRLNLGSDGITNYSEGGEDGVSGTYNFNFYGGTIGALSNWSATINFPKNFIFSTGDVNGDITFDTQNPDTTDLHTININIDIVGTSTGNLIVKGGGTLNLSTIGHTFAKDVQIQEGTLLWGNYNGDASTISSYALGTGQIYVSSGATLSLKLNGDRTLSARQIETPINMADNSTLYIEDGSYRINELNVAGNITIQSRYSKIERFSKITGAGDILLLGRTGDPAGYDSAFYFDESDSAFTGSVTLRGTTSDLQQRVEASIGTALKGASVTLDSSAGGVLLFRINAENMEVAGLNGTGDNNSIDTNGGERTLTVNGGGDFTGALMGNLNIVKRSADTLIIRGASPDFNRKLTVEAGMLDVRNADIANAEYVLNGGTLSATLTAGQSITSTRAAGSALSSLTLAGGTVVFESNPAEEFTDFTRYDVTGDLSFGTDGAIFKFITDAAIQEGTYTLMALDTALNDAYLAELILDNTLYTLEGLSTIGTRYDVDLRVTSDKRTLQLYISGEAADITWVAPANGIWKLMGSELWTGGELVTGGNVYFNGDTVSFGDVPSGDTEHRITIEGTLTPAHILVNAESQDYIFSSADNLEPANKLSGVTRLEKDGGGKLTIDLANDYSGGTVLKNGELIINAAGALGSGPVTMSGGILEFGTGTLASVSEIAASGGTLKWSSGNTDDISGKLTATNGSSVTFEIDSDTVTFGTAITGTGVNYTKTGGGTLTMSGAGKLNGTLNISGGEVTLTGNSGGNGVIYGNIVIQDGGTLNTNSDTFGYSGGANTSVRSITIDAGGKWVQSDSNLTLGSARIIMNGGELVNGTGGGRVDLFGGSSAIETTEGTESEISVNTLVLRQDDTLITVAENATLTISGAIATPASEGNGSYIKQGEGTLILTADNTHRGTVTVSEGTLQIGNGGTTGSLGEGEALIEANGTLTFNRSGATTIGQVITGSGTLNFDAAPSSNYILAGDNTFTGTMNIKGGVTLADNNGLGASGTINILDGGSLDYAGYAASGTQTLNASGGASLASVNGVNQNLNILGGTVTGTGGLSVNTVTLSAGSHLNLSGTLTTAATLTLNGSSLINITGGDLSADSLLLKDEGARIKADGNITVSNGGEFRLDLGNQYVEGAAALVQGGGDVTITGQFTLNIDANIGDPATTYYLFGTGNSGTYSTIDAQLGFAAGSEYLANFFNLDVSQFPQSGKVTISREDWIADLYNQQDVTDLGGTYTPAEPGSYLGAKAEVRPGAPATQTDPVIFDSDYNVADNAYKLTDGLGWLDFQTQMTGSGNKLLVSGMTQAVAEDAHGIIISNNNNNFDGGTAILDAHVILDGGIPSGEANTLLGSGKIDIGGNKAKLELRPGGAGDASAHTFANELALHDGASLIQSGGNNILSGAVSVSGTGVSIVNATDNELILTNSLTGASDSSLTLSGGDSGSLSNGVIRLEGATGTLNNLTLSHSVKLQSDNTDLSVQSLTIDGGSDLNITNGSKVTLSAVTKGTGTGAGRLLLNGGTLSLSGTANFNGSGEVALRIYDAGTGPYALTSYNTIDVSTGGLVTINGLGSGDGSFLKTGEGLLVLAGEFTSYTSTATVGQGRMNLTALNFGGSLVAGVDGTPATLAISANVNIAGALIATQGSTVTMGAGITVNNGLLASGATLTAGNGVTINGSQLEIGENTTVTFGRDTVINTNINELQLGTGTSVRFGKGSTITGTIANGISFNTGSTFGGFLDAGGNDLALNSGFTFLLNQSDVDQYSAQGTIGLTTTGNITIENGAVFQLENGLDFTSVPVWPDGILTLVSATEGGTLLVDGEQVITDNDYTQYLGETDYAWYIFNLIGGENSLNLEIKRDIRFETVADTANEQAMAQIANELANKASTSKGEIRDLAAALAMSSNTNVHGNLSQLSLSVSGVMAGYVTQMENLRRHSFELLNRAVQEKTASERLSYEENVSSIWANGQGGTYKLDGGHDAVGSTTNVWGGTVGASTEVGENLVLGVSFTYTNSDTRLDRAMGKAEGDAYNIDLFGRYHKDNWNVVGIVTGGFTSLDIERDLTMAGYGSRSKGSPDGSQIMATVQVGYEFTVSRDMNSKLEPFALISGGYSSIDGYTEKGAGNAGLTVESQSQGLCTIGAGVRFVREYFVDEDEVTRGRFEARALVLQDLSEMEAKVDANFIGLPGNRFHVEGATPGRTAFVIGAGVVQPLGSHTSLFLDIDGEFRNGSSGVGGVLGVKYSF